MVTHLRPDFLAGGAPSVAPVLFGTPALSAVSVFATAHAAHNYRFGRKVNRLHSGHTARAVSDRHSIAMRLGQ